MFQHEMRNPFFFQNPIVPQEYKEVIVSHVVYVHTSVLQYTMDFATKLRRRNYITPWHFMDFINTYLNLLVEKKNFINSRCTRLSGGSCKTFYAKVRNYFIFLVYFLIRYEVNKFNNISLISPFISFLKEIIFL